MHRDINTSKLTCKVPLNVGQIDWHLTGFIIVIVVCAHTGPGLFSFIFALVDTGIILVLIVGVAITLVSSIIETSARRAGSESYKQPTTADSPIIVRKFEQIPPPLVRVLPRLPPHIFVRIRSGAARRLKKSVSIKGRQLEFD